MPDALGPQETRAGVRAPELEESGQRLHGGQLVWPAGPEKGQEGGPYRGAAQHRMSVPEQNEGVARPMGG